MDDERHPQVPQPPADRGAAAVAQVEVYDDRREFGMLGGVKPGLEMTGGNDPGACRAQGLVDFEGNERLILDDKDKPPYERAT
jgi:hypothetical protein